MATGQNPISYSDLFDISDKKVINDLIRNLDKIDKRYMKLAESTQKLADVQKQSLERSVKDLITMVSNLSTVNEASRKSLLGLSSSIDELNKRQKEQVQTTKAVESIRKQQSQAVNSMAAEIRRLSNQYTELARAENQDKEAMKSLRGEIVALKTQQKAINDDLKVGKSAVDAVKGSYIQLEQQVKANIIRLKQMPDALKPVSDETKQLIADIRQGNQTLKDFDKQIGIYNRNVGNYADGFKNVSSAVLGFSSPMGGALIAISAVAQATTEAIKANLEYSDSLADVQRTASLTADEADNLVESLKEIDTRTSLKGLIDLSIIGGNLGIAKNELAGFTKAIDQLAVVLDKEIEGGAEGIAKVLGTVNNVFKVQQKESVNTEQALLKTGSAILKLGQEGLATGGNLADFTERVGGIANIADFSLPSILAYGATLQEAGISAEVAGTAFTSLITQLAKAPKDFFKIAQLKDANLTLKEYTNLINTDTKKALDLFLAGLGGNETALTNFATAIKDTGVDGQRAIGVLATLSRELGTTAEKTNIAKKAFDDGSVASEQFRIKNENLAGALARLGKEFSNVFADSDASRGLARLINDLLTGTKESENLARSFEDQQRILSPLLAEYDKLTKKANELGGKNKLTKEEQDKLNKTIQDIAKIMPDAINGVDRYGNIIDIARSKVDSLVSSLREKLRLAWQEDANGIRENNKELLGLIDSRKKIIAGTSGFFDELFTISKAKALEDLNQSTATYAKNLRKLRDELKVKLTPEEEGFLNSITPQKIVANATGGKTKPTATGGTGGTGETETEKSTKRALTAIEKLQEKINKLKLALENQALAGNISLDTLRKYTEATNKLEQAQQKANLVMLQAVTPYKALQAESQILTDLLAEQIERGEDTSKTLSKLALVNDEVKVVQDKLKLALAETVGGLELLNTKLELSRQAFEREASEGNITTNTLNEFLGATNAVEQAQLRMQRAVLQATDPMGLLNLEIQELAKSMEKQVLQRGLSINTIENYINALDKLNSAQLKLKDAQNKYFPQDVAVLQAQTALTAITPGARRQFDTQGGGAQVEQARLIEKQLLDARVARIDAELKATEKGTSRYYELELEKTRITAEQEDARTRITKEKQDQRNRILDESTGFAKDLISGLAEISKANGEIEIANLEAQKNKELSIVGNNSDAKNAIEKKYAKQQADIKRRQAEADKRNSLFQIAIETALGVTKAITASPLTFGLPWSAFVLANGALQATLVASKPIPAYEKGTKNANKGLAIVGEKGVEAVESRDGSVRLTGSSAHLTYLEQGDKVYTATSPETQYYKELLSGRSGGSVYADSANAITRNKREFDVANTILMAKQMQLDPKIMAQAMKSAINESLVIERNVFDEYGYSRYQERHNQRIKRMNSRNTFGNNG